MAWSLLPLVNVGFGGNDLVFETTRFGTACVQGLIEDTKQVVLEFFLFFALVLWNRVIVGQFAEVVPLAHLTAHFLQLKTCSTSQRWYERQSILRWHLPYGIALGCCWVEECWRRRVQLWWPVRWGIESLSNTIRRIDHQILSERRVWTICHEWIFCIYRIVWRFSL